MEFALVAPVFLMMLLGTIELARYYFMAEALRTLSAETARAAFISTGVSGCPFAAGTQWNSVNKRTPFLDVSKVSLCITRSTDAAKHTTIQVTASYVYKTLLPILSRLNATLQETTQYTY